MMQYLSLLAVIRVKKPNKKRFDYEETILFSNDNSNPYGLQK